MSVNGDIVSNSIQFDKKQYEKDEKGTPIAHHSFKSLIIHRGLPTFN
jgi:hypothetical protein